MKTLTQKEIIDLVRAKKLSPEALRPYQEVEDKKEVSGDRLLIKDIKDILEAIKNQPKPIVKADIKDILEIIKNQPKPIIKVENIIEKEERKKVRWEFEIIRNSNGDMEKITAVEYDD